MGLKKDKKGMIAVMDAFVFILLLSMAATWLFVFENMEETEEPMAKTISDDIFSMEVRTSDLTDLGDTKVLPIDTLIAANMYIERTYRTEMFLSGVLEQLIPQIYGYELILEFKGHTLEFHRDSDRELSSECCQEHTIDGVGVLKSTLKIY